MTTLVSNPPAARDFAAQPAVNVRAAELSSDAASRATHTWWARRWQVSVMCLVSTIAVTVTAGALSGGVLLPLSVALGWAVFLAVAVRDLAGISTGELSRRAILAMAAVATAVAVLDLGRTTMVEAWLALAAGVATFAVWWTHARRTTPKAVIVGDGDQVARLISAWGDREDVCVAGAVVFNRDPAGQWVPHQSDVLGPARWAPVADAVASCEADLVICLADGGLLPDDLRELSWSLESSPAQLVLSSSFAHASPARIRHRRIAGHTMTVLAPSRPSILVGLLKSGLDRLGALVLLTVLAPVLLGLTVLIRLDSPGSAVFRQVRVGRGGRPFTMYKFRSMVVGADAVKHLLQDQDEGNGVLFKVHADPRVTRVGRMLRRTSLDELPQLVNVLKGEMSLVGPRPALPIEVAGYDHRAQRRLATRPGLTGLWQVSGRSDLGWEESLALDLDYTDNIALSRDLAICVNTVQAVVSGRGAY